MRILSIRFKNLNSLAGEWEVDFTHPAYTADGIFAITGPTGAGKTTLLDAICLALYGETPRLDKITQSSNEIMSRQTGECFAEVTFSTQHGTFRCHWSQHRARKQADGKLQNARHEIVDALSGKIIDNQIRTVAERIVQTTGMDFRRFTQSMMLAQGGFAAFLKASADERAPILEQITGTEIYSDISRQVHIRHAEARNDLQVLEAELTGMQLLNTEQEAQLQGDEQQLSRELKVQRDLEAQTRKQHDWKKLCLELQSKADRLAKEHASWTEQHTAFAAQRDILANAIKALELSASYAAITALRNEQQSDQQQLTDATASLPALQEKTQIAQQHCKTAEAASQSAETALRDMRPIFKKVHLLDQELNQANKQEKNLLQELRTQQTELDNRTQAIHTQQQSIAGQTQKLYEQYPQADGDLNRIIDFARQKLTDAQAQTQTLTTELQALLQNKNIRTWRQQKDEIEDRQAQLGALQERLAQQTTLQNHIGTLNANIISSTAELDKLSDAIKDVATLVKAHDRTLTALRQQQIQQQRILSLEEQRQQLLNGEPCPLCGSTKHPFAEHDPLEDGKANNLDIQINEVQNELITSQQRLDELGRQQIKLQTQQEHDKNQRERETNTLNQLIKVITTLLHKSGIEESQVSDQVLSTLDGSLRLELERIRQTLDAADSLESDIRHQEKLETQAAQVLNDTQSALKDIEHLNSTVAEQQIQMTALNTSIERLSANLEQHLSARDAIIKKRQALLGDRDPDQKEALLESILSKAQTEFQLQQKVLIQAENDVRNLQQSITALEQRISNRVATLNAQLADFTSSIKSQGFADEQHYLTARLDENERRQLQTQNDALNRKGIELQAAIAQNQQELTTQLALNLNTASLDTLQHELASLEQKTGQLQEQLGGIRQALRNNEQQRQQQQTLAGKIDQQKTETDRWARLHELIGSADGKKFRNFAQGLTFDMMIIHANQQLQKMTERYLLQRDPQQPLDLNVIDNFQAGEVRSTKNLSGGESFIVSLALALGLSRMASRNVRVDSLFLDEGFGTLDEEALDTALDTLTSLQQEGKLIGIISHVPALKERIATQIRVSPVAGGRSSISGPGCRAATS